MKQFYLTLISIVFISFLYAQEGEWNQKSGYVSDADTCDFITDCDFIIMDTSDLWEIGITNKSYFASGLTGEGLMTDTMDTYPIQDTSFFELDLTVMSGYDEDYTSNMLIIDFKHKMQSDTLKDGGFIQFSLDSGSTWMNLIDFDYHPDIDMLALYNIYSEDDTLFNSEKGFSGTFDWTHSRIEIGFWTPIKSMDTDPRIRFYFLSDNSSESMDGWIIDSLSLTQYEFYGSVDHYSQNVHFEVFPNPVEDWLTLKISSTKSSFEGEYVLLDLSGRKVKSVNPKGESTLMDLSGVQPGLYIVRWEGEDGSIIDRKVVVK